MLDEWADFDAPDYGWDDLPDYEWDDLEEEFEDAVEAEEEYFDELEEEATRRSEKRIKKPNMIVDGAGVKDFARLQAKRDRRTLGEK